MGQTHLKSADYEISPSKYSTSTKNITGPFSGSPQYRDDIQPFSLKLSSTEGGHYYDLRNERGDGGDGQIFQLKPITNILGMESYK